MAAKATELLNNGAATSAFKVWPGGRASLVAVGTMNGAAIKLQMLGPDGATAIDIDTVTSFPWKKDYDFPAGAFRLNIAGGPPSGVYATIAGIPHD